MESGCSEPVHTASRLKSLTSEMKSTFRQDEDMAKYGTIKMRAPGLNGDENHGSHDVFDLRSHARRVQTQTWETRFLIASRCYSSLC